MYLKNYKGITLIALVIMIVILVVIATVAVKISSDLADTAKFQDTKTNLLIIQTKCKIIAEKKAIGEITEEELYGSKQISGDYTNWYLLSMEDLNNMGLQGLDDLDGYYVDYENDDVAISKGITYEGTTYYKLSEMDLD